jgi:transcription antitermination factor NusG
MLQFSTASKENAEENADATPLWHVIHCRPRCEKKAAEWLQREAFEVFLPLRESLRIYPTKRVIFHIPLFPGYLFAKFPERLRRRVWQSEYVARVLEVFDQEVILREMKNIRILLLASQNIQEHPFLQVGRRVRVVSGKLKGLEGFVETFRDKYRIVISVELFQQSVCLEIDPRLLREVDV